MTILLLRRFGSGWELIAPKGHVLVQFYRCPTKEQAYAEARAWASSWSGIDIRFEDEQGKTGN